MRRNAFDIILVLVILAGGALAWSSGRERSRLSKEHARLARITGNLTIDDPTKAHLVALDTGEPLHFAWRVYLPANYPMRLASGNGSASRSSSSNPTEGIIRLRFREKGGILEVYTKGIGGSSRTGLGDATLADLLRGRWGEVEVEQLGAEHIAIIDPDEQVSLVKLKLPEGMRADPKLSEWTRKEFIPVFYELKLGTAKP